jgi:AraC-like DNA-binding protein
MKPDLELVQVRDDQSFKVWSHGYPFRTVRWHFHPEYEIHLVTSTRGTRYVGDHIGDFAPGDLVLVGPNLPHNWISDVPAEAVVDERCLVLQFTDRFIRHAIATFPEMRMVEPLLLEASRGVLFSSAIATPAERLLRDLLPATGFRRISLFVELLGALTADEARTHLVSGGFRVDPSAYLSSSINRALLHIAQNIARDLRETDMARLCGQSPSTFSRAFRRHTGVTFVHYINTLRVELACQHLTQDELNITDIGYDVGFNNLSNFNRQFLALKGMTPSRFRELFRKGTRPAAAA